MRADSPPLLCLLRLLCKEPGTWRGMEEEAAPWALSAMHGWAEKGVCDVPSA